MNVLLRMLSNPMEFQYLMDVALDDQHKQVDDFHLNQLQYDRKYELPKIKI